MSTTPSMARRSVAILAKRTGSVSNDRGRHGDGDGDGDNPNNRWKELFQSLEYQPIWTSSSSEDDNDNSIIPNNASINHFSTFPPLPRRHLDMMTKDVMSRLDDMAHCTNRTVDICTTQECNFVISKLVKAAISESAKLNSGAGGTGSGSWYSHRAYLILKRMHLCHDIRTDLQLNLDVMSTTTTTSSSGYTYMSPQPNHETYTSVLQCHVHDSPNDSDETGGKAPAAPRRALEIVQDMERRYTLLKDEMALVSPNIWNRVIECWAQSNHADKSYEAAHILKHYMLPSTSLSKSMSREEEGSCSVENVNGCESSGAKATVNEHEIIRFDISSYHHVFQACATSNASNPRERELAGKIALAVWKDWKEQANSRMDINGMVEQGRGSHMIVSAMNAVGISMMTSPSSDSDLSSVQIRNIRNEALQSQFETACQCGIVTAAVLQAFQTNALPSMFNAQFSENVRMTKKVKWDLNKQGLWQSFASTREGRKGSNSSSSSSSDSTNVIDWTRVSPKRLYTYIPKDWKRNAFHKNNIL